MNINDRKVRQLFRETIRQETKRPEVRQAKRDFIREHFEAPRPFFYRPTVMVPSLALLGLLLLVLVFPRPLRDGVPVTPLATDGYLRVLEQSVETAVPSVQVKRVTSHVGPTLVYQKLYQDTPITIVWVFHGGVL